ncbi:MAG: filamentous hemagglutinin family protein [Gammaproteobacteria bacterium]|nr:filamentous hemagglutinin family protein [Gammaproteobacteria bacterium]
MRETIKWAVTLSLTAPALGSLSGALAAPTLPVPCAGGACGVSAFVTAGQATAVQSGSTLTVTQQSTNATLNWQSFNIASGGTVQFVQPSTTAVALNRIYQADPSQIFGTLTANGRVFLINQNGIVFGAGAQVNVGGLLASSLDINPTAVSNGLTAPGDFNQPALQAFANGLASGDITIGKGATITTAAGGQVLVFAPNVTNQGSVSTPGGQTVLAAGQSIYLASSSDPNLRGLLVEVGANGGTVTNGLAANSSATSADQLVGQISATDGNVTLAGLAVNQLGRVSATTSINENGSIRLQAGDGGTVQGSQTIGGLTTAVDGGHGTLTLGTASSTSVTLDTSDPSTTIDANPQPKSAVSLSGKTIQIDSGALVRATSGNVQITAQTQANEGLAPSQADGSRIYIAPGATIDVSGASTTLPVSINVIPVQLRGSELANSPLQQNGPLRGQTVYVDIRQHGTRPDGSTWIGTPFADVSGEIAAIGHNVVERNLAGGTISLNSHGDALVAPGATLDLAGGVITYTGGEINTSKLLLANGRVVDIGAADPNAQYVGLANSTTANDPKWGTSTTSNLAGGNYVPGYLDGQDAGSLQIVAPTFVLDGNVQAAAVSGLYQRLPSQALPSPAASVAFRPYDQIPLAASLTIGTAGNDFITGNVSIAPNLVLPTLLNAAGGPFDPAVDPLPASVTGSILRPALLGGPDGFGHVTIYSNGQFVEPNGAQLNLPAGGSFSVNANVINLEGSIFAPGGSISAVAQATAISTSASDIALTLGPQSSLSTAGTWVNDNPLLYPNGNAAPIVVNGGSVTLEALAGSFSSPATLDLVSGSRIDVSGGAQLSATGQLNAGSGGQITLVAANSPSAGILAGAPSTLDLGASLDAFGLYHGGSLSLTASGVCIASADCSGGQSTQLWLNPDFFANGGFASYAITAAQGAMTVLPGTVIRLQQQNLQLASGYQRIGDLASLAPISTPTTLIDRLRAPVSLTLAQNYPANNAGVTNTLETAALTDSLTIGAGAQILADPGANLSLVSNVRMVVDGTLSAPGGDIALSLLANQEQSAYDPTQAIWIGAEGVLDAAGTTQLYVNSAGQRTGTVFAGGNVSLDAARGYVEILPGSVIDVAGTSGTIDVAGVGAGVAHSEVVGSAGGTVSITAAEGASLGGTFEAAAGRSGAGVPQPAGGSFSLTLNGSGRNDYNLANGFASSFPQGPRQIDVAATQTPLVIGPGSAVPIQFAGHAYVSANALQTAGFDSIALKAAPLVTSTSIVPGQIDFTGDVTLAAGRLITLDAASFRVDPGVSANVIAPYVEFGNSDQLQLANYLPALQASLASQGPASGALDVSGQFVELYGSSVLSGIGNATFASSGDLRVLGLQDLATLTVAPNSVFGGLYMSGDLSLRGEQIYPSTLSQFVFSADPASLGSPTAGSIHVNGAASGNNALLSAGGALTLSAGTVVQDGVLRAPFGSITIDAQTLSLGAGSLTSTSADGLTVPFGTTQGGLDWVYPLANNLNLVYGTDGIAPPSQRIVLQGTNVDVAPGAVVDVSGGGDLQAYEWIPGVGGTNDVLSNTYRPNQYAILPGLAANVAPYDPSFSTGSSLQVGDAVYLSAAPGLAAGTYQLLPARYALLPGAFLVTAVPGYQDIQPGQSVSVLGGGTIVSGYQTVAGTAFGSARTSGFEIQPAALVLQQAEYTTTGANQFFASQASAANLGAPSLPVDSGLLALAATQTLGLGGTLLTTPGTGGTGAEVDIASANILVSDGTSANAAPGTIVLSSASLAALNAQTLLLGGQRDGGTITTTAQIVEIGSGVTLSVPEVQLTARQQVSVDSGASLAPSGTAASARSLTLDGSGAFLDVSSGAMNPVSSAIDPSAGGVLSLASGSRVGSAGGAITIDATQNAILAGDLSIAGGDLALRVPTVALGTPTSGFGGTVLGANVLGTEGLRNLTITSSGGIDFFGALNATAQNVTLDSASLNGFGASGDTFSLNAVDSITLQNSAGPGTGVDATGTGTLQLSAANLLFGGGSLVTAGFSNVMMSAAQQLTATADASLQVGGGANLTASAARITTGANVNFSLAADGQLRLGAPSQSTSLAAVTDLGGTLSIRASNVEIGTTIDLPSGSLSVSATGTGNAGNVLLDPTAVISVAGLTRDYSGTTVASPGGTVTLTAAANVDAAAGSSIDVSAGSGGAGGSLAIDASAGKVTLAGTLAGAGSSGAGASFQVDAQNFGDFASLDQILNSAGFGGTRSFHLRGPGDLVVGAGDTLAAQNVSLIADQGAIRVDGSIDASGTSGGQVLLAARDAIAINGAIDAQATKAGGSGGNVAIETSNGGIEFGPTASIAVGGGGPAIDGSGAGGDGTVLFRVPRGVVASALGGNGGVALDGTVTGSARTTLEAFAAYQNSSGSISTTDQAVMNADAVAFMNGVTPAGLANLGAAAGASSFVLAPGVEIDATTASNGTGTLALNSAWNLYGWRYGANAVPGILTLRAQNGVTFNASLSDGFTATSGTGAFTLPTQAGDSWSYRIVAGADFGSADPLAVGAGTPADVTIAPCTGACSLSTGRGGASAYAPIMVRTGNGFIDVAASGNFVLGSQASILYTAGVAGPGIPLTGRTNSLGGLAYPSHGGDVSIDVGGNVVGAATDQFVNAWLWRLAPIGSGGSNDPATAWTVNFASFQQGVGALGGGDVTVRASGDVRDLSVSIPSIGVQVGGTNAVTSVVDQTGGGRLVVTAGGSILGGSFYAGLGSISLDAGNDVGAAPGGGNAPLVGLGNASLSVTARDSVAIADVLNPTLLNLGAYQSPAVPTSFFSTYGADSSVDLTAIGGTVALNSNGYAGAEFAQIHDSFLGGNVLDAAGNAAVLALMPPVLDAYALSGTIQVGRQILLAPSPGGDLRLFADQNIDFQVYQGNSPQILLSDASPALLPSLASPQPTLTDYQSLVQALATPLTIQHAPIPIYAAADAAGTLQPAQVVARTGSIEFPANSPTGSGIWSAKPIDLSAGLDIVNLNLVAQNLGAADATTITAGRNLTYPLSRQSTGGLSPDTNGIAVDGPGQLLVAAGGNIDLGTSAGIVTRANLVNTNLPAAGASISVQSGTTAAQYAAFVSQYIQGSDVFDAPLVAYVEGLEGTNGLDAAQAKKDFAALGADRQRAFVESVFFDVLRTTGRAEAASGNGNFTAAFAAIQTLFPGANPDTAQGQTNPYTGNIDLYFSRIYTEQGGGISLLAPGGGINVGLAIPPAAFAIDKQANQLGIVARTTGDVNAFSYGDFQVNQSRVFAADGGNILVWSTAGNIDAGRGAKTAISAPALNIVYDQNGQPAVTLRAAIAGSGIQALAATPGVSPGNVDLFAPRGVVNANDAGIVAGNLTVAATAVLGANNITVSGTSVGVPVVVTGVGTSVAGAAAAAAGTSNLADNGASQQQGQASATPAADTALSWLDVFVTGLGEDNCRPDDLECLKKHSPATNPTAPL